MSLGTSDARSWLASRRPDRLTLLWAALAVNVEVFVFVIYVMLADPTITNPLYLALPFVWINVAVWAVVRTDPAPTSRRRRLVAASVGVGYLLVLAYVGGLVGLGHAFHGHGHASSWRLVLDLPPGWGPALLYGGQTVTVSLIPYKLVGYVALAYLVYATVLDAAGSALSGVLGLFSCVSCAWPLVGTVAAGLFGSTSTVAAFATTQSYGLSTLVFLSAVGLLYWRPGFGGFR